MPRNPLEIQKSLQKQYGCQRLILGRSRHVALHRQMRQKPLHLRRPQLARVPLTVELNEALDLIDAGLLGPDAGVMPHTSGRPHLL
jgi:hypothetical protein